MTKLFGGRVADVPCDALTMGMGTIMAARKIVLLTTGPTKANAVARMLGGCFTTDVPASLLQLHPDVEVFLDQKAASRLHG
jgi:glucosamine-6-phosphate deaminase